MKHSEILKRAWKILWDYKALWIFGIILALTTASSVGNQFNYSANDRNVQPGEMQFSPDSPFWPQMRAEIEQGMKDARDELKQILDESNPDELERTFVRAALIIVGVLVILGLIGTVLKYIAQTALIKMVDHFEETAEKLKVREGWQLGWSRHAWRVFLVDLVIFLPAFIVGMLALMAAIVPIITISSGMPARGVLGLVASIGLIMILGLFGLAFAALVSLVKPVVYRKVVLEDQGAIEGINEGWAMFRQAWKQYGLLWLILKGINLVWPLAMFPFALVSGGIALLMGGGFTFLTGGNAIESGDPAMVGPIIGGIIVVIVVLIIPLSFLAGLRETFQSTSWTLAYRELRAQGVLDDGNGGTLLLEADPEA